MNDSTETLKPGALLEPDEPPAVIVANEAGSSRAFLVADHAGRAIPRRLGTLGVGAAHLDLHIACDIGIGPVTRMLSELLDAPAVIAGYSRLAMDLNRVPGGVGSFVEESDGIAVPGNRNMTEADRLARQRALFDPYHETIARLLRIRREADRKTMLVCLHSFTPSMDGFDRPWHIGVLWNGTGEPLALRLIASLETETGLCVGNNEPYDARGDVGFTQRHHAVPVGMPNLLLEIRQDLIAGEAGQREWAERLAVHLTPILADDETFRPA